ncbi:MAG: VRR-NUC domain-containing protein, partial [Phocaeicola sp.]
MTQEKCSICGRETISVIQKEGEWFCYNCYADKKAPPNKPKRKQGNEEARMQSEFFKQVPMLFPNLPDKLLFAVPNGGSRNKIEAANLKRQGATAGVSDVICLIPKKGFASLC